MNELYRPALHHLYCEITRRGAGPGCLSAAEQGSEELRGRQWIAMAQRIHSVFPLQAFFVDGSDPLLYPDLLPLIRGLDEQGIRTVLHTPGNLLAPAVGQELAGAGLTGLVLQLLPDSLSLGPRRGSLPSFLGQALQRLKTERPQLVVGVSIGITAQHLALLPLLVEALSDHESVDEVHVTLLHRACWHHPYAQPAALVEQPCWPKDAPLVRQQLPLLARLAESSSRFTTSPEQLDTYQRYLLDPAAMAYLPCPAARLGFALDQAGAVFGCPAAPAWGRIQHSDPAELYRRRGWMIWEQSRDCTQLCFHRANPSWPPLPRWRKRPPVNPPTEISAAAPLFPPELRELTREPNPRFKFRINYKEYQHLDLIGRQRDAAPRTLPFGDPGHQVLIFLCGHLSEMHRWGVALDENDFFKQTELIKTCVAQGLPHRVIIGVRRTNFHQLPAIYDFVRQLRGEPALALTPISPREPQQIRQRFYQHLAALNQQAAAEDMEFRVVDEGLDPLLCTIEAAIQRDDYLPKELLLALGPVCKDVFTGPAFVLYDPVGRCNTDCIYCRSFSPLLPTEYKEEIVQQWSKRKLPLELIKNTLAEAKELEVERILVVGRAEPTLHPQFGEMLQLIRSHEFRFNLSTNGTTLHRYAQALLDSHCDGVTVSLSFASAETFKKIRPHTNLRLMHRIERNVRHLAALKRRQQAERPMIIALYAICALNYQEIVEMVHHAHRLGADAIWFQLVHLDKKRILGDLGLNVAQMVQVRQLLQEAKHVSQELGLVWQSFIDFELEHFNEAKGDWSTEGMLHQGCYVGWHFTFINLTEELYFCCGCVALDILPEDGHGLAERWYSERYRRYRNDALIMHRENPIDLYAIPLFHPFCDSCDNHDQQLHMLHLLDKYQLLPFVER